MRLTVCGNARSYLAPWSAGTAYVVEAEGAALVVDCGLGTLAAIGRACAGRRGPVAVVVSHFHHDHAGDLVALAKALPEDTPLYAPADARANLDHLARGFAFRGSFDPPGLLVEAAGAAEAPPFALRFAPAQHRAPGVATSVAAGGRRVVLAGDGAATPALLDLARGADLLVAHTLLPDVDPESEHARAHMTAAAAGRLARDAGVARLLLCHVHHRTDPDAARAAAAASFPAVQVGATDATYEV